MTKINIKNSKMDISIIILNYKSKGFTLNCIKSIKEAYLSNLKYEIIVVDNNSQDGIKEILAWQNPEVKVIVSTKNLGMGAGNNLAIKQAQGEFIVIMNPDTLVFKDTFQKLYQYMQINHEIGVAGPMQFNPDQTIQDSCFRWCGVFTPLYRRTPLGKLALAKKDLDRFLMKDYNKDKEREVDWLLGSFLFCRAKALAEVGLFDQRFFLYFEDIDLCRRFWQAGWKVVYYPEAKIIHNHLRLSAHEPWYKFFASSASRIHIISWLKYLKKWGTKKVRR